VRIDLGPFLSRRLADEKRPNFFWNRLAEGRYLDGLGDRLLAMALRAAMSSSV
jgi:hypothetical protein